MHHLPEVYKRISVCEYSARVLRYSGNTRYGKDGNPLAVIDSEMPETLRRLGLWKTGDALPVPAENASRMYAARDAQRCRVVWNRINAVEMRDAHRFTPAADSFRIIMRFSAVGHNSKRDPC